MNQTVLNNLARCWAARQSRASTKAKAAFSSSISSVRIALDRVLSNRTYLRDAYLNGIYVKAKLCSPFLAKAESENVRAAKEISLYLFFELLEAGRAVPLIDLQRQAWKYLHNKARYFSRPLTIHAGGSIARGEFKGFKAFEELCTLIRITEPADREELTERMHERSDAHTFATFMCMYGGDSLKYEIKTNAAVALTCFGSPTVIDIFQRLVDEEGHKAEGLRCVTRDLFLKLAHFSPLYLGIMYPSRNVPLGAMYRGDPPEGIQEDINTLHYSGHALEIARELDSFHDDPINREIFREVTTSLPDEIEAFINGFFPRTDS